MDKGNLPFSCKVRKKFLDPFDIGGVLFTIWEMTYKGKDKKKCHEDNISCGWSFFCKKKTVQRTNKILYLLYVIIVFSCSTLHKTEK